MWVFYPVSTNLQQFFNLILTLLHNNACIAHRTAVGRDIYIGKLLRCNFAPKFFAHIRQSRKVVPFITDNRLTVFFNTKHCHLVTLDIASYDYAIALKQLLHCYYIQFLIKQITIATIANQ